MSFKETTQVSAMKSLKLLYFIVNRNEAGLTEIRHNLRKPIVSEIATIEKCCPKLIFLTMKGGFQLLDLIITELKSHVTWYNSMPLIG